MSTLLNLIIPGVKKSLVDALPVELGLLIASLPSPVTFRGDIKVAGTSLSELSKQIQNSALACAACKCSPQQMEMFVMMQKHALGRSSSAMSSMSDFLVYMNRMQKHPSIWQALLPLWQEACVVFSERVRYRRFSHRYTKKSHCDSVFFKIYFEF